MPTMSIYRHRFDSIFCSTRFDNDIYSVEKPIDENLIERKSQPQFIHVGLTDTANRYVLASISFRSVLVAHLVLKRIDIFI